MERLSNSEKENIHKRTNTLQNCSTQWLPQVVLFKLYRVEDMKEKNESFPSQTGSEKSMYTK